MAPGTPSNQFLHGRAPQHNVQTSGARSAKFNRDRDIPRLEIDNNIAENAMRCVALGRKNYLFAGSDAGGDRAAAIYTIVRTAKLNGLNPETYLRDVLTKIAEGHTINKIDELLPWSVEPKP